MKTRKDEKGKGGRCMTEEGRAGKRGRERLVGKSYRK